jgi:hypothetical protein
LNSTNAKAFNIDISIGISQDPRQTEGREEESRRGDETRRGKAETQRLTVDLGLAEPPSRDPVLE